MHAHFARGVAAEHVAILAENDLGTAARRRQSAGYAGGTTAGN
jgi:hypothetical protein